MIFDFFVEKYLFKIFWKIEGEILDIFFENKTNCFFDKNKNIFETSFWKKTIIFKTFFTKKDFLIIQFLEMLDFFWLKKNECSEKKNNRSCFFV